MARNQIQPGAAVNFVDFKHGDCTKLYMRSIQNAPVSHQGNWE